MLSPLHGDRRNVNLILSPWKNFYETSVKNKVNVFNIDWRQLLTIMNLRATLKEDISYSGSHSSRICTLLTFGFNDVARIYNQEL